MTRVMFMEMRYVDINIRFRLWRLMRFMLSFVTMKTGVSRIVWQYSQHVETGPKCEGKNQCPPWPTGDISKMVDQYIQHTQIRKIRVGAISLLLTDSYCVDAIQVIMSLTTPVQGRARARFRCFLSFFHAALQAYSITLGRHSLFSLCCHDTNTFSHYTLHLYMFLWIHKAMNH